MTDVPPGAALPEARRALVVAAHPDDIESWCAGTLALLLDRGIRVDYLLCTRGDKGSSEPDARPDEVASVREREQREAAALLGVGDVEFLGYPDGFLEDTPQFREEMTRVIRSVRPDVLFTHDPVHPYPPYTAHRDHRVAGRSALDAVYPMARDRLYFPEHEAQGLRPHKVREVWLYCSSEPDTWVSIDATFERKVAARLAHSSQTPNPAALRESWLERALQIGGEAGLGAAEAFKVVRLGD
jgi:LmbE family N-acetylglucosaminyl deacetylase